MTFRRLGRFRIAATFGFGVSLLASAGNSRAAVVEPNGLQVPNLAANTGPNGNGETDLGTFFKSLGETFDVMADANSQPAVFSPMCDFSAGLILSQSQGLAGVAWYNVPADPTAIPDKIYQILPPSNTVPATGGVISSSNIRNDPNYAGGLIGFVLTDNGGRVGPDGTVRLYYSEPSRNDYCSGCTTPGYWVMMLAYKSTLPQYPNTYYLAFEDWLTTSSTSLAKATATSTTRSFESRVSSVKVAGNLATRGSSACASRGSPSARLARTSSAVRRCLQAQSDVTTLTTIVTGSLTTETTFVPMLATSAITAIVSMGVRPANLPAPQGSRVRGSSVSKPRAPASPATRGSCVVRESALTRAAVSRAR